MVGEAAKRGRRGKGGKSGELAGFIEVCHDAKTRVHTAPPNHYHHHLPPRCSQEPGTPSDVPVRRQPYPVAALAVALDVHRQEAVAAAAVEVEVRLTDGPVAVPLLQHLRSGGGGGSTVDGGEISKEIDVGGNGRRSQRSAFIWRAKQEKAGEKNI